nr:hypothetical protein [Pirellulimonas nuda]
MPLLFELLIAVPDNQPKNATSPAALIAGTELLDEVPLGVKA